MKIIKNEKLIKRYRQIGSWTSLGAMAVLGIGMYLSFTRPESYTFSLAALVIGFLMTQVGMHLGNKYGRSPRPDEKLDAGLKGLPGDFSMYHYVTPVSHLLLGPAGVWILMAYHQSGKVAFTKNRWRLSGGGFMQGYMRIFGQEGLGRPDLEIEGEINSLRKFLAKRMDESEIPAITALMVFTSDNVDLDAEDTPIIALKVKQIKDFIRRQAKQRSLSPDALNKIKAVFE